jgi:hypothetical protein
MSPTPTSLPVVPPAANVCAGTCTWEYNAGSWTILSDDCGVGSPCGCYDAGTANPGLATINARTKTPHVVVTPVPGKKPKVVVSHEWFLGAIATMKADPRLVSHPKRAALLAQPTPSASPAAGATYEMPCVRP